MITDTLGTPYDPLCGFIETTNGAIVQLCRACSMRHAANIERDTGPPDIPLPVLCLLCAASVTAVKMITG